MPHRSQTLASRKKVVLKVLPAMWKWKESIPEINTVNSAFVLKEFLILHLSKIRKLNFLEYDPKKPRDNFARCSICDRLHSLCRTSTLESQVVMLWARKLKIHLDSAMAHWELYFANHCHSRFFLDKCVIVMHDKMDHSKIASPVFLHKTKQLDGLMKLHVSITGMLVHGHVDV
jgi:hypothetical protein